MLHEKQNVRQIPGEPLRRWFADDYFELIVWFSPSQEIEAFELSYEVQGDWQAIKWSPLKGCHHYQIDAGEGRAYKPQAVPTLQLDSNFSKAEMRAIYQKFQAASQGIDSDIARFVAQQILRYDPHPVKW